MKTQNLDKKTEGLIAPREVQLAKAVINGDACRADVLSRKAIKANYRNTQSNSKIKRLENTETPLYLIKEEGALEDRLRLYKAGKIANFLISTPYGVGESTFYVFEDLQKKDIQVPHNDLVHELSRCGFIGMSGLGRSVFEDLCDYSPFTKEDGKSVAPLIQSKGKDRLRGFIYDYILKRGIEESPFDFAEKHCPELKQPRLDDRLGREYFIKQCYKMAPVLNNLKRTQLDKLKSEVKK